MVGCWALIEVRDGLTAIKLTVGMFQVEVQDHVSTIGGVAVAVILILTINMIIAFYMCACGMDRYVLSHLFAEFSPRLNILVTFMTILIKSLSSSDIDDRPRKRAYGRPSGRV